MSGSLHFRIKIYCSDEDKSPKLCCFCHQDDSRPMSRGDVTEIPQCWRKSHQQPNSRTAEAIQLSRMQLVNSWTIWNYFYQTILRTNNLTILFHETSYSFFIEWCYVDMLWWKANSLLLSFVSLFLKRREWCQRNWLH